MLNFIKKMSLIALFMILYVNCDKNDNNLNPGIMGTEFNDSNPYKGEYSGTCRLDGTTLKLVFSIDDNYYITGSEVWPAEVNYQKFEIEGEITEDGEVWMYCEYEENGITYTSEYEGTIRSTGKVSGDAEVVIAGISFEGTWSANKLK